MISKLDELMCRNIKTLYNYDPPATDEDIRAAALQYVRKISGFTRPSKANQAAVEAAVESIAAASTSLLRELQTTVPPRDRAAEIARSRVRHQERYSK
jgi:hypothetical protein